MVSVKDILRFAGVTVIAACAVFISTLFLNFNIDLKGIEEQLADIQTRALYDALVMSGKVVSAVSGGCLLLTSAVMLCFYIGHYIDAHRRELGVLKALGFSALRAARGFWVFGSGVFAGAAVGYGAAHCVMPLFYKVQCDGIPEFGVSFHFELAFCLVILPTAFFALFSVVYGCIRLHKPALELINGKPDGRVKPRGSNDRPFLSDLRRSIVRSRKALVFFIGFAAFCFSAMVQMSFAMNGLSSALMAFLMLGIGLTLAFVTLFIAADTVVGSNAKTISIMSALGYSRGDCSSAVLSGYRPAALIGFAVGTLYQHILLKIAVNVVFSDIEGLTAPEFDLKAFGIAAAAFAAFYETIMYVYSRRIGRLSVKRVLSDAP